jgi:hypothetical protein
MPGSIYLEPQRQQTSGRNRIPLILFAPFVGTHSAMVVGMTNTTPTDARIYLGELYASATGRTVRPCGLSQYANGVLVAYGYDDRRDPEYGVIFTSTLGMFRKLYSRATR